MENMLLSNLTNSILPLTIIIYNHINTRKTAAISILAILQDRTAPYAIGQKISSEINPISINIPQYAVNLTCFPKNGKKVKKNR